MLQQAVSPVLRTAYVVVARNAPEAMRWTGFAATTLVANYGLWKFNQTVLDPMVERVTGGLADLLADWSRRSTTRQALKRKRDVDLAVQATLQAMEERGEITRTHIHTAPGGRPSARPRSTPRPQPHAGSGGAEEPVETDEHHE